MGPSFVALMVCDDDIIITGVDSQYIDQLKSLLNIQFKLKDLGSLKCFLGQN